MGVKNTGSKSNDAVVRAALENAKAGARRDSFENTLGQVKHNGAASNQAVVDGARANEIAGTIRELEKQLATSFGSNRAVIEGAIANEKAALKKLQGGSGLTNQAVVDGARANAEAAALKAAALKKAQTAWMKEHPLQPLPPQLRQ